MNSTDSWVQFRIVYLVTFQDSSFRYIRSSLDPKCTFSSPKCILAHLISKCILEQLIQALQVHFNSPRYFLGEFTSVHFSSFRHILGNFTTLYLVTFQVSSLQLIQLYFRKVHLNAFKFTLSYLVVFQVTCIEAHFSLFSYILDNLHLSSL